jgi:hypothetical protein
MWRQLDLASIFFQSGFLMPTVHTCNDTIIPRRIHLEVSRTITPSLFIKRYSQFCYLSSLEVRELMHSLQFHVYAIGFHLSSGTM